MRRGLIALTSTAVVAFAAALFVLRDRPQPSSPSPPKPASERSSEPSPEPRSGASTPVSSRSSTPQADAEPPGLKLGKTRGPSARATAQAILDDALAELRRLGPTHRTLARDVYMRGHSAAERVEDELDADDEPGLAELRADEDAMKAELRRIYEVDDDADSLSGP